MWRRLVVARANFRADSRNLSNFKSLARYPLSIPRNIIHSDVSVGPESESRALSIAPTPRMSRKVGRRRRGPEQEGEGEVEVGVEEEDEDGDDGREEGDSGD